MTISGRSEVFATLGYFAEVANRCRTTASPTNRRMCIAQLRQIVVPTGQPGSRAVDASVSPDLIYVSQGSLVAIVALNVLKRASELA